MKRLLTGITGTGILTLGNYIGSVQQILKMQDEAEIFLFVANLHSLTVPFQPELVQANSFKVACLYLACGISSKVNLFVQSEISAHSELCYILLCLSTMGELSKMTQFKDKTLKTIRQANKTDLAPTGLFIYPGLMAADILLYNPDLVPVGADQKQHLELTRLLIKRLNKRFACQFKLPQPVFPSAGAKIKSLIDPSKKMSKTDSNSKAYISLLDDKETVFHKIKTAVTDSENCIDETAISRPGIANLLCIYQCLSGLSEQETLSKFAQCDYATFKKALLLLINNLLFKIQTDYNLYVKHPLKVKQRFALNLNYVRQVATANLEIIKNAVGLNLFPNEKV